ncbi:hypothetical protein R3P38DRAFT_3284350, partial [Favolaschia claudopus]
MHKPSPPPSSLHLSSTRVLSHVILPPYSSIQCPSYSAPTSKTDVEPPSDAMTSITKIVVAPGASSRFGLVRRLSSRPLTLQQSLLNPLTPYKLIQVILGVRDIPTTQAAHKVKGSITLCWTPTPLPRTPPSQQTHLFVSPGAVNMVKDPSTLSTVLLANSGAPPTTVYPASNCSHGPHLPRELKQVVAHGDGLASLDRRSGRGGLRWSVGGGDWAGGGNDLKGEGYAAAFLRCGLDLGISVLSL